VAFASVASFYDATEAKSSMLSKPGTSYRGGGAVRLSMFHSQVPTSLDQLLLKLKILFTFFTKQATLMRKSTVLSRPPQAVLLDKALHVNHIVSAERYDHCLLRRFKKPIRHLHLRLDFKKLHQSSKSAPQPKTIKRMHSLQRKQQRDSGLLKTLGPML
jgi:hypothetical protein